MENSRSQAQGLGSIIVASQLVSRCQVSLRENGKQFQEPKALGFVDFAVNRRLLFPSVQSRGRDHEIRIFIVLQRGVFRRFSVDIDFDGVSPNLARGIDAEIDGRSQRMSPTAEHW